MGAAPAVNKYVAQGICIRNARNILFALNYELFLSSDMKSD